MIIWSFIPCSWSSCLFQWLYLPVYPVLLPPSTFSDLPHLSYLTWLCGCPTVPGRPEPCDNFITDQFCCWVGSFEELPCSASFSNSFNFLAVCCLFFAFVLVFTATEKTLTFLLVLWLSWSFSSYCSLIGVVDLCKRWGRFSYHYYPWSSSASSHTSCASICHCRGGSGPGSSSGWPTVEALRSVLCFRPTSEQPSSASIILRSTRAGPLIGIGRVCDLWGGTRGFDHSSNHYV